MAVLYKRSRDSLPEKARSICSVNEMAVATSSTAQNPTYSPGPADKQRVQATTGFLFRRADSRHCRCNHCTLSMDGSAIHGIDKQNVSTSNSWLAISRAFDTRLTFRSSSSKKELKLPPSVVDSTYSRLKRDRIHAFGNVNSIRLPHRFIPWGIRNDVQVCTHIAVCDNGCT